MSSTPIQWPGGVKLIGLVRDPQIMSSTYLDYLKKLLYEQGPEEEEETPPEGEEAPEATPEEEEEALSGDFGGFGEEEEKSPAKKRFSVGRTYELKKIYARLLAIDDHLNLIYEPKLEPVRELVDECIDLFYLVIWNHKSYKDKIDDIIVAFYKFLDSIYSLLREYYKKREQLKKSREMKKSEEKEEDIEVGSKGLTPYDKSTEPLKIDSAYNLKTHWPTPRLF